MFNALSEILNFGAIGMWLSIHSDILCEYQRDGRYLLCMQNRTTKTSLDLRLLYL